VGQRPSHANQAKNNIKLWSNTGLRQSAHNEYCFNPILRKRHLEFNLKLHETRLQKKQCVAEPPTNPAASISFLLCSPDDLLREGA
jgi:hypothetical protein